MIVQGLPHTRGGVSVICTFSPPWLLSSPHTWGCFLLSIIRWASRWVFPTHVGVFPLVPSQRWEALGLPHTRGGVSENPLRHRVQAPSSPHTWGCFCRFHSSIQGEQVFPTHVGVFLLLHGRRQRAASLPHTRGGVSVIADASRLWGKSSPHTWGCFRGRDGKRHLRAVFPTHVGVFRHSASSASSRMSLPHTRGGVSFPSLFSPP